ncbi:MAG TPA: SDR family NAD(P)-dependent oxidoreductase [Saprospiraceae bacterium]|nr:SDR family NAD(P)-dependent oxidoreductase [Saprospiraceae bacterium]HMQ82181.1 SDR family NAD(P)-dependent oxidoreductase [Saprospiraceae bacterium]
MPNTAFSGQRVLITGSSRGVGRACALAFAAAGAKVVIHYHQDENAAHRTLEEMPGNGHLCLQANLEDPHSAHLLVQEAHTSLGGLDILVNNAGIFLPHAMDQLPFDEWLTLWQRTLAVNLTAAATCAYTAAEYMRQQGHGKIINIGSRGGYRGEPGQPGYGASKAGLHAMSQSMAQALGSYGITVHAVAPGFIETAMARPHLQGAAGDAVRAQSPLNRVATVQDVAHAVLFLASPEAAFSTGCVLDLNGASYLH